MALAEDIWTIFALRFPGRSVQGCHFYADTKCSLKLEYLQSTMDGTRAVRKELIVESKINNSQKTGSDNNTHHYRTYYYSDDDDLLCVVCCCCGRNIVVILHHPFYY